MSFRINESNNETVFLNGILKRSRLVVKNIYSKYRIEFLQVRQWGRTNFLKISFLFLLTIF